MDLRNYIFEKDFKINLINNQLDIVNYIEILNVTTNQISLKIDKGTLIINGNNLSIKKLLNDEILIIGDYTNIEFR